MIFVRNLRNAGFPCASQKRKLYGVAPRYFYEEGTKNGDMHQATKFCREDRIMTFYLGEACFDGGNLVLRQTPPLESHHG